MKSFLLSFVILFSLNGFAADVCEIQMNYLSRPKVAMVICTNEKDNIKTTDVSETTHIELVKQLVEKGYILSSGFFIRQ